tara:strand:- start:243 stop:560 length:318 start_codon:yes stop_codon:yes gene_type:complete
MIDKLSKMRVENMISSSGNSVPNQYEITTHDGLFFQSYKSLICFIDKDGRIFLDENKWNYSVTTSKYRNKFLNETTRETEKKIKDGTYFLYDLNSNDALHHAFFK